MKNIILMTMVASLAVGSIFLSIDTATTGVEMAKLEKTESEFTSQKQDLEESLVKTLSATSLQEKSVELGFVKPDNLVYIASEQPVAKLP